MKMYLSREFKFDSAHNLVRYHGKCENLHGHTYKLKVTIAGVTDESSGMIMDFNQLNQIVKDKVIERLDHHYLNEIVEQSTAENLVQWIWNELKDELKGDSHSLFELILWETESSSVILRGE